MADEQQQDSSDLQTVATDPYADYLRKKSEEDDLYNQYASRDDYEADLRGAYERYVDVQSFEVGDMVEWKAMLRNLAYPRYEAPAVVVSLTVDHAHDLSEELIGGDDHNILIGYLDGNQVFRVVSADPARLTRWRG